MTTVVLIPPALDALAQRVRDARGAQDGAAAALGRAKDALDTERRALARAERARDRGWASQVAPMTVTGTIGLIVALVSVVLAYLRPEIRGEAAAALAFGGVVTVTMYVWAARRALAKSIAEDNIRTLTRNVRSLDAHVGYLRYEREKAAGRTRKHLAAYNRAYGRAW